MRHSIKEPIAEIFEAYDMLSLAVDFHIAGEYKRAETLFRQTDSREIWNWINPGWTRADLNVVVQKPDGDSQIIPKEARDPDRRIGKSVREFVLRRDGYRCRYCGIPVVDADIRKIAHRLYPDAIPWINQDAANEHAAFQCLWLQYDHVIPHSHGGQSNAENIVICCALCNFGKDRFTLRQLGLVDPRLTPPVPSTYDGLERLRAWKSPS
jgi:5-methylcytosine-specific restriction endonuclease McrA